MKTKKRLRVKMRKYDELCREYSGKIDKLRHVLAEVEGQRALSQTTVAEQTATHRRALRKLNLAKRDHQKSITALETAVDAQDSMNRKIAGLHREEKKLARQSLHDDGFGSDSMDTDGEARLRM